MGGHRTDDVVDPVKVRDQIADGATVVLQSLQRTWPPIARFAAALERDIGHTVQANAYLTPATSTGLRPHCDGHDVIVLQIWGSKRWTVDGLGTFDLGPGDTLYIPAGTEHVAETGDEPSLHLTIGILRRTYRTVIERLLKDCDGLDRPLPLGSTDDRGPLEDGLRDALARAVDHLAAVDVERSSELLARRRSRRFREGTVYSVLVSDRVDERTTVALDDPEMVLVDDGDDRVRLVLGDRTLDLPRHTRAALCRIQTGVPVLVGDLDGLNTTSRIVLARRLVREGVLAVID